MFRNLSVVCLALIWFVSVVADPACGADKKKAASKADPALATVEKVLRAESAGEIDRRAQLAETLNHHPDSAAARWQAGFIREGQEWIAYDDSSRTESSEKVLSIYRQRRVGAQRRSKDQLDLANWCRANKLPDQERAHLSAALSLGAGDASEQVAERLGYRQVCGRWLSREQLKEWSGLNDRAVQSLKKWEPQLAKLADRLGGSAAQRESAIASLKKNADDSAIRAIEYVLAGRDEATAQIAVEALRSLEGFEASIALARQGVFSPWPAVRESAALALKGRPLDYFVPDLMALLSTPIKSELQVWRPWGMSGTLYYNLILAQETGNQFQVAVLTEVGRIDNFVVGIGARSGRVSFLGTDSSLGIGPGAGGTPLGITDLDRVARDRLRPREDAVDRQNEAIAEVNRRVSNVLGTVSGEEAKSDPHEWWQWWASYADLEYGYAKEISIVSEDDEFSIPGVRYVWTPSCFAAGTPVWTESGPQPIESVQIGDRVLAKNVETGELAYKPVLHTTVRPPKELTTLRFGDETIVCTGGHRFWSSGSGWIKARDLTPQTLLHSVTGNTPVWSARKGNTAETYNLVVADFHTYFVGKTGVLCQDLLIPRGTDSVVPGLPRSHAVAAK
jgi:hypothetical protein